MRWILLVAGGIGIFLGGLWLLQGLALVEIAPILCVADCQPLVGGSPTWAIIGFVVLAAGAAALLYVLKRYGRTSSRTG